MEDLEMTTKETKDLLAELNARREAIWGELKWVPCLSAREDALLSQLRSLNIAASALADDK